MFVDPPYTAAGKRAGSRLYTHTTLDHEQLFADVARFAGPALLTYDDTPEVRELADRYNFQVGNVAMKSTHHAVMHELTIFKVTGRGDLAVGQSMKRQPPEAEAA